MPHIHFSYIPSARYPYKVKYLDFSIPAGNGIFYLGSERETFPEILDLVKDELKRTPHSNFKLTYTLNIPLELQQQASQSIPSTSNHSSLEQRIC